MFSRISLLSFTAIFLLAVNVNAKVVTEKTAQSVARNFMDSRGLSEQDLVLFQPSYEKSVEMTKTIDAPAYHIFRAPKNKELIVVSGDDIARPILGYCFDSSDGTDNQIPPAMKDWLDEMERQILKARKEGVVQSAEVIRQWSDPGESGNIVKQLNTAKWNQLKPYNLQCPSQGDKQCYTGCTSTAYAILMKYYGYPSSGRGVTPRYICSKSGVVVASRDLNHTYDWESMPLEYNYGEYTSQQANNVAQLMADIGAAIQADYSNSETMAYNRKGELFKYFGYNVGVCKKKSDYTSDEWNTLLKNALDQNRPVLYNGKTEDAGGHAFIIDGYTDQDYFCVNWGWGGSCDGAFALDALIVYDYDYTSEQIAYVDFMPAEGLPAVAVAGNDIECPSLEAAVSMVPANGEQTQVKILQDLTMDEVAVEYNQNVELDLNGFTISIESYSITNRGKLTIIDSKGTGKINYSKGNSQIISNSGILTVNGGEFLNLSSKKNKEDPDYRRCIWAAEGSNTVIRGGKFKGIGQVICVKGGLTIDDGEFETTGNNSVISNYSYDDLVVIRGGTFKNNSALSEGTDYRRVYWCAAGTETYITGGTFTCIGQTICSNGEITIENGEFICTGNAAVAYNYSETETMNINGGTFRNTSTVQYKNDYRRSVWAAENTTTKIKDGMFSSENQVLTFIGKAFINGGTIEGNGIGCLSHGDVLINDCKMSAYRILVANTGYTLKCYGGIYSKSVDITFLGQECQCIANTDASTSEKYPYRVKNNNTGIDIVVDDACADDVHYNLNGMISPDNSQGIQIIRKADGSSKKVLNK